MTNEKTCNDIVQELIDAINASFPWIDIHGNKIIEAKIINQDDNNKDN